MLNEIISNPIAADEKLVVNPYPTNLAVESSLKRPLSESKNFNFEDLKRTKIDISDVLKIIGWKQFCEIDEVIYTNLVQKFYSLATVLDGHDVILCCLNQTDIIITTDILAKVFNIPNSGVKLFGRKWYDEAKVEKISVLKKLLVHPQPARDYPITALKNEFKINHNLCTHSLLPRSGSKYRVNDTDLMIIYHLVQGKRVNLPYIIIQHMKNVIQDTKGNGGLPYSMPLTKIFKEFQLSFIGEEAKRIWKPFNSKNVSHIKLNYDVGALALHQIPLHKEEYLKEEEEEENPLHSLVNAIIVESHRTTQSASLNSKESSKIHVSVPHFDLNLSTDLNLSSGFGTTHVPISTIPPVDVNNSALFESDCLNKFLNSSPKNIDPLPSELPPLLSHFSSFGSFRSTATSPINDPPFEPQNPTISNEIIYAELTFLHADVHHLHEYFVAFLFTYYGMVPPAPTFHASSSNPPPHDL